MSDRQCPSCGGFCGRGGCKRENVKPEQKPVAVVTSQTGDPAITMSWHHEPALPIGTKLYAAPPARKPLSDERLDQIIASNVTITDRNLYGAVYMAIREVEQEHGIGSD